MRDQDQGDGADQEVVVRLMLNTLLGHELWSPSCVQGEDVKKRGSSPIDEPCQDQNEATLGTAAAALRPISLPV